jgi:hypothetical protein
MESITNFRCYQDDSFSNLNVTNNSCDYIPENSIYIIGDKKYSIYTDSKYLKIICNGNTNDKNIGLKIMNVSGQVFININKHNIDEEPINIEYLPRGTYILTINNLYNHKFAII